MREKSYVEDIDRSIYDFKDDEKDAYKVKAGLTPEIVQKISDEKKDPAWMQLFRLRSLQIYNQMPIPDWGPSIEALNMDDIVTYVRPNTKMKAKWSDVPDDIKNTFERLGIPQAERKSLAGVGAQYDSELVYHNVRAEVAAQAKLDRVAGRNRLDLAEQAVGLGHHGLEQFKLVVGGGEALLLVGEDVQVNLVAGRVDVDATVVGAGEDRAVDQGVEVGR